MSSKNAFDISKNIKSSSTTNLPLSTSNADVLNRDLQDVGSSEAASSSSSSVKRRPVPTPVRRPTLADTMSNRGRKKNDTKAVEEVQTTERTKPSAPSTVPSKTTPSSASEESIVTNQATFVYKQNDPVNSYNSEIRPSQTTASRVPLPSTIKPAGPGSRSSTEDKPSHFGLKDTTLGLATPPADDNGGVAKSRSPSHVRGKSSTGFNILTQSRKSVNMNNISLKLCLHH
jgi:hypothetical protein